MPPEFDVIVVHYKGSGDCGVTTARHWESPYRVRYTSIENAGEPQIYRSGEIETVEFRRIVTGENLGWVKGANVGLALSTAPYVVLMNDDVEVKTDGWLELLREVCEGMARVACVAPGECARAYLRGDLDDRPGVFAPRLDLGGFGIGDLPLSFSCVMFRREALVDVGYLDERFNDGYGGDDDDWQCRAHLAGWQLAVHPGVEVEHVGSASWGKGEKKAEAQARNVKLLREKYKDVLS